MNTIPYSLSVRGLLEENHRRKEIQFYNETFTLRARVYFTLHAEEEAPVKGAWRIPLENGWMDESIKQVREELHHQGWVTLIFHNRPRLFIMMHEPSPDDICLFSMM
jgi:hypothetical protein